MKFTLTASIGSFRRLALATVAAAFCAAAFAQTAGAAATLNVSTDADTAGANTSLTVNTALTGLGNAKKQYGATVTLPSALRVGFPAYGNSAQQCPANAFSTLNTGITPVAQAFSNAGCPAEAKVGTATLGSASGSIYWVGVSPIPQLGVYFDTGVTTPYGRKLTVNYNGSTPTMIINGLPKTTTNGLTLSFNNPSRPNLPTKIWNWAQGNDAECTPTPAFTGSVRTWPNSGTVATNVSMAAKSLTLKGCGVTFAVTTDTNQAGVSTALTLATSLAGTGNDAKQYGARITLPPSLRISFPAYGNSAQQCPANAFSTLNTGITPAAQAFSNAGCPAEAKVGTVALGSASGSIYWVDASPLPQMGIYFDSGVAVPYGRRLSHTYDGSTPTLTVNGLPNSTSTGLVMTFHNPNRPVLSPKIWQFATAGDEDCAPAYASATVNLYPTSGTVATAINGLYSWLNVTGCV